MSAASGYLSEDTIVAIATAVGGPIAMLRISGPRAFALLAKVAGAAAERYEPRKLARAELHAQDGALLDDALAARFPAPNSYTGEDVVELHVHGGAFTTSRALEALLALGARQALPGEFSFRAFRNGKLTLSQAHAVSELISASNEAAVTLALEKMSGAQHKQITAIAEEMRKLVALSEAGIDFSDQDLDEVSLPVLKKSVSAVMMELESLKQGYRRGARIQEGTSVAFVGLPNVGKSSFFNALLGEDRSIVSDIPGTTRDIVREKLTLRGRRSSITLRLEDTAGLRASSDHIERIGMERARESARRAELVLFLVDASTDLKPALEEWRALGVAASKTIGVLTKTDLVEAKALPAIREKLKSFCLSTWVETSALRGSGIHEAAMVIAERCESELSRASGEILLTRLDHLRAVESAFEHLKRALSASEADLFASDLRQGLHALSPLIGETLPDDILGRIFSEFCIGK